MSEAVTLHVIRPTGIDEEAYSAVVRDIQLKSEELSCCLCGSQCRLVFPLPPRVRGKIPTSTYAAYVIYERMAGFAKQDSAVVLGVVHDENSYNSNSYPDDTGKSKDGWQ